MYRIFVFSVLLFLPMCRNFGTFARFFFEDMNRRILQLAVPSILANITIPLVGLVDTAIVGHISDATAIGGIAIGTMLFDLLYWNFGFLRVGTSGLTAQAFGRGDRSECRRIWFQSVGIALSGALLIWLLQWLFVTVVLACVPCSAEVADFARRYFFVRIWAAPATLNLLACKGWFIGMQDTVSPMLTDLTVNIVNIVASYLLAVRSPLGPIGVAYGTLLAQYSGLLLALGIVFFRYHLFSPTAYAPLGNIRQGMCRLLVLNGNIFVRCVCVTIINVGFTSLASRYGDTALAVSAIMMKLFLLFSYFTDGFAYAGEALVGRYIGSHDGDNLQRAVRVLFVWSLSLGVVFSVVYAVAGEPCFRLLTSDLSVVEGAAAFRGWLIAMPLVSAAAYMWDGIYAGATAGREMRNGMIFAAVSFIIGYAVACPFVGIHALYVGFFAHLVARIVYLSADWHKVYVREMSV